MELVYIILKGITKFSKEEKKMQSGQPGYKRKIIRRIDRSKFKLSQIKIKDPAVWDVLKSDDFKEKEGVADGTANKMAERKAQLESQGKKIEE